MKETETGPGNTPIAEYDYTYRPDGLKATETDDFWFANNGQNVEVTNTHLLHLRRAGPPDRRSLRHQRRTDPGLSTRALPSDVRQWDNFNDRVHVRPRQQHGPEDRVRRRNKTADETINSTYDANDRLLEQVDTTSAERAARHTTTEYTYNDTEQTSETVNSGTPSSPGNNPVVATVPIQPARADVGRHSNDLHQWRGLTSRAA